MQASTRERPQALRRRGRLVTVGAAGLLAACANDDIVVTVSGLDAEVRSLQVSLTVDGQPLGTPQTVSRTLSQFVINLPAGQGGNLTVNITGQVSPDCKLSEGSAQLEFTPGGLKPTMVQVALKALPALWCSLPGVDLRAVWGSSPQDVWAAGANTAMLHWDDSGSGWQRVPATLSTYNDLWGSSASDVYAVAQFGAVERWNGSSWTRMTVATSSELHSVFGLGPSDVWFVGDGGAAVRWNGTSSTATATQVTTRLSAVWAAAANDVWAAGQSGNVLHWTGSAWTRVNPSPSFGLPILALAGTSGADVWAFGGSGVAPHYDGRNWTGGGNGLPTLASGNDLWAASFSEVWGAASAGNIVRWDGSRWNSVPVPSSLAGHALKLWGVGSYVWVVIQGGTLLRFKR